MKKLTASGKSRVEITESAEVEIEDNAEVSVVIRPSGSSKIGLRVGKNCHVESYVFQENEASITQTNHVGGNSIMRSHSLWLAKGNGSVESLLEGHGAEAYDLHILIGRENQEFRLEAGLQHVGKATKGAVAVRGIVRDSAWAKLDGMIRVAESGAGAESTLTENVMLLNPGAHAEANPELEIKNNDVQCTHAATVSQIGEEKIFYLMSRGMSREDAKKMIVRGFLESEIGKIKNREFRETFLRRALSRL